VHALPGSGLCLGLHRRALTKKENGTVHYDVTKCIGCRYCMVACPFEIPAYEYHDPITPRVMKCTFCYERVQSENKLPGCAEICPVEAITFGKRRSDLLSVAHQRIQKNPGRYIDHVYGEKRSAAPAGCTCLPFPSSGWASTPCRKNPCRGWRKPSNTLFSYLWSPIVLFGMLGGVMWASKDKGDRAENGNKGGER
jgi:formate dehydrogenase iron-sulfur subunit